MPIQSQLPVPTIPKDFPEPMRDQLVQLYTTLRNWVSETANTLGQFQGVPVRNQLPLTGQALVFDGQFWTPGFATGSLVMNVPLAGAVDGVNTTFTLPFTLALDTNGVPQALLLLDVGGVTTVQVYGVDWTYGANVVFTTPPPNLSTPLFAFAVKA